MQNYAQWFAFTLDLTKLCNECLLHLILSCCWMCSFISSKPIDKISRIFFKYFVEFFWKLLFQESLWIKKIKIKHILQLFLWKILDTYKHIFQKALWKFRNKLKPIFEGFCGKLWKKSKHIFQKSLWNFEKNSKHYFKGSLWIFFENFEYILQGCLWKKLETFEHIFQGSLKIKNKFQAYFQSSLWKIK